MTVLVTGGTGLVGSRLLPRLVSAGIDCRALVRAGKTVAAGATAIEGDLLDPGALVAAVDGVDAMPSFRRGRSGCPLQSARGPHTWPAPWKGAGDVRGRFSASSRRPSVLWPG